MKIGVMQPYFFPYIGYWQLMNYVDAFVILDDVNFIKKGFIHRNQILLNGGSHRIGMPLEKPSQNKLINQTRLKAEARDIHSLTETIKHAYSRAPHFTEVEEIIRLVLEYDSRDLVEFLTNSMSLVNNYLGIDTRLLRSSSINKDASASGEARILSICKAMDATQYVNPSGGRTIYTPEKFTNEGIDFRFLDPDLQRIKYRQFDNEFVENLSIIDVMMFNDVKKISDFLTMFSLSAY